MEIRTGGIPAWASSVVHVAHVKSRTSIHVSHRAGEDSNKKHTRGAAIMPPSLRPILSFVIVVKIGTREIMAYASLSGGKIEFANN